MNIFVSTLFKELYASFLSTSIIHRAIEANMVSITLMDMFSFVESKKRIDSPVVGHGAGMLLGAPIVQSVYEEVVAKTQLTPFTIFFSPHGKKMNQQNLIALFDRIKDRPVLLFSGRYEGFDVRAEEEYADEIISIGDYVLFGGDLPAMVFLEGLLRLIPGVVGKMESVLSDSFSTAFVDHPHYALPDVWKNRSIPSVLKSGNHEKIRTWRLNQAVQRTVKTNWKWVTRHSLTSIEKNLVKQALPNHYCALLHNDIMLPDNQVGNSSVTSIDIHDIARSSATYGIKKYFVVTRLWAQKKLVEKFLSFWHEKKTGQVNESRAFALKSVALASELTEVVEEIKVLEGGVAPVIIVTSSRRHLSHKNMIEYDDQEKIWELKRPVLFVFGTSHGISPELMDTFDYRLVPLEGLEEFNFLSVRSAAAIVFDRWLGFSISNK
jgi:tRNA (guanine37-N1)-methyltransferase